MKITKEELAARVKNSLGLNGPKEDTWEGPLRARKREEPSFDIPADIITKEDENPIPQVAGINEPIKADLTDAAMVERSIVREKIVDGRFQMLEDIASNFLPYESRNSILARPFSVVELKLIARAIETGDADFITQAIDNCVDIPVHELTITDYFHIYYWMRISSYPNTPHYMEWVCDEEHDGQACNHENLTPLTQSELRVVYLSDLGYKPGDLDPRLDFPRVSLLQDLHLARESKELIAQKKEAEFSLDDLVLINAAKWIKAGKTLRDKIKILEAQPDLELYELASKANKAYEHGVHESAFVKCGRCGAKRRYRVLLDAPRFFPFVD